MAFKPSAMDKKRFYLPFIMAFMVFSAILATEYLIVEEMLDDLYSDQSTEYHALSTALVRGIDSRMNLEAGNPGGINSLITVLREATGINGLNIRIEEDTSNLSYSYPATEARDTAEDESGLENLVIERTIAKLTNGETLLVEIHETNKNEIKYLEGISKALIIILILMITFAVVPGALVIESMARRRKLSDRLNSSSAAGGVRELPGFLALSRLTGYIVVSGRGRVLWSTARCRELLEISDEAHGYSLPSVTSLPDSVRLGGFLDAKSYETQPVWVKTLSGERVRLIMEVFPLERNGGPGNTLFAFTAASGERAAGGGPGSSESFESLPPAVISLVESVLHGINNQLSGIMGAASVEMERADTGSGEAFSTILESAEKLSGLCGELQVLLTGREDQMFTDPMEEVVRVAEVLKRILPPGVRFQVSGGSDKMIHAARESLRDLIYNLALNSTGLMNGEGRIRMDVSERMPSGPSGMGSPAPGSRVCLRYTDGFIMPVALRDVLSSRNYSVSDVDREFGGTIASMYRALRETGGKVFFERGSGETVLCIVLDAGDKPEHGGDTVEKPSEQPGVAGLSVLVAEEVELVRNTTCEYLEHRGMGVTPVADGESAMELLRRETFDAAVLDLNMAGTPTPAIVRYCQTSLPDMAVVITTGYGAVDPCKDLIRATSTDCLYKPHRPEVLVETIYSILMRIQEEDHS